MIEDGEREREVEIMGENMIEKNARMRGYIQYIERGRRRQYDTACCEE